MAEPLERPSLKQSGQKVKLFRLVLWKLYPCWLIILCSVAAPLLLLDEQYQELLMTQPTLVGWQYLLGSYLFLQLAMQICIRASIYYVDRKPLAPLSENLPNPLEMWAKEWAIISATSFNLAIIFIVLLILKEKLSLLKTVDTSNIKYLMITALPINLLVYWLVRCREVVWHWMPQIARWLAIVAKWINNNVLNYTPQQTSIYIAVPQSPLEMWWSPFQTLLASILRAYGAWLPQLFQIIVVPLGVIGAYLARILLGPIFIVALFFDPIDKGWTYGPIAVVFYIGALWLVLVTVLTILSRRTNIPILIILIILALVFGYTHWRDNHDVRVMAIAAAPEPTSDPARRNTVADAVAEWRRLKLGYYDNPKALPLILVATAGGGQRAALWTVVVLTELEQNFSFTHQQLFAISGVSGGALGAALYVAVGEQPSDPKERLIHFKKLLAQDFLTPLVARLLTTDLIQPFFPLGFKDRAATLEETWERGWAKVFVDRPNALSQPFLRLWADGEPWPALFLNGTWVENGQRVIASNLRLGTDFHAYDVLTILGHDIAVSTAVNMSTRFAYVTPAGVIRTPDGKVFGNVVDGGYYDNFGAATALEILRAVTADDKLRQSGQAAIVPIVVTITNDPEFQAELVLPSAKPLAKSGPTSQFTAPIETLDAIRNEHGKAAFDALKSAVGADQDHYFHFRLCEKGNKRAPILGWAFNPSTVEDIVSQRNECGNDLELARFAEALKKFNLKKKPDTGPGFQQNEIGSAKATN